MYSQQPNFTTIVKCTAELTNKGLNIEIFKLKKNNFNFFNKYNK